MKKQYYIFLIIFLLPMYANSTVTIVDSNVDGFPKVTAKFFLLDNLNKVITDVDTTNGAIKFYNNGTELTIDKFSKAQTNTEKSSVVIAFDLAIGQRSNSLDDFSFAKDALNEYLSYINENLVELALLSFSQIPSIETDFTNSTNNIEILISELQQSTNSNISKSFTNSLTGSLNFLETSHNQIKSILLVTQGLINLNETELIINKAKQNGITVNILYVSSIVPNNIRRIAIETEGFCINIDDLNKLRLPYLSTLAKLSEGYKPYEITASINDICEEDHLFSIYTEDYSMNTFSKKIKLSDLPQLEANPKYLEFPLVELVNSSQKSISFTANYSDVLVKDIFLDNPLFVITSGKNNLPKLLKVGEEINFTVRYEPIDSGISFARLIILSDVCISDTVFLTGGFPNVPPNLKTIKITQPTCDNQSEKILVVGDTVNISWRGVIPKDVIQIMNNFNGTSNVWQTIGNNVVGLNFKWLVPNHLTDSLRFSINQYWPSNLGKTLTFEHNSPVTTAFFNALEDRIITTTDSRKVSVWNANTGELIHTFDGFNNSVRWAIFYSEPFSVEDKYIAVACEDSTAYLYDASNDTLIWRYKVNNELINSIEFSKDGKYIVLAVGNGVIEIVDVKTGKQVVSKKINDEITTCRYAQFHPLRKYEIMAITSYDGIIRFFDIDLTQTDSIDVREGVPIINTYYATYNWDGSKIAFINLTKERVQVIDRNNREIDFAVDHKQGTSLSCLVNFANFFHSNNENYLLTAGTDFNLMRWKIDNAGSLLSSTPLNIFIEHTQTVNTGVFSSDGWRILSASNDNTAKIWNLNQRILQSDTSCYFKIDIARAKTIDTIDFGDTYLDNINIKTIEKCIENLCNFSYDIKSIRIIGDNPGDFNLIEKFDFPLKFKGKSDFTFNIYFQPQDADIRTAKIQIIIPNDTLYIVLKGNGINIGLLPVTTHIDFGDVVIDDVIDKSVPVAINVSDNDIIIKTFSISGLHANNFREFFEKEDFILKQNDTLSVPVRFFPINEGKKNAVLYLFHSYHNFPMKWNLRGNGIELYSDTINLQIGDIAGEIGQTIDFPLYIETLTNNFPFKLESILFSLTFNSSLLYPSTSSNEVKILDIKTSENYLKTLDILIPYKYGKQRIDGLKFLVTFGNDIVSNINLSNIRIIGNARIFVKTNNSKFTMLNVCDADGTRSFDEHGKLELSQNYPNPAVNESRIDFEILENGWASIKLYNLSGNLVKTFFDGHIKSGKYFISFFASDYLAGTYYYILETSTTKITKTLVIE